MKSFNGDDVNISRLIETRMLISANSGGGKSWALRNLLERTHGKVQQIVLDMEGEFSTLREKYDYVLVGKGGDIPADVRSAAMLATKLLELEASAIVDLYELPQHERIRYVRFFLEAMVNAPKELWHPVLVVLDEAHVFAPEKRESEAMNAVADMATRGRKRGYGIVVATQRLSKLNKDVAAELNNVLIGRTGLDIDAKRAAESLGFTTKDQLLGLRKLTPGEFYAYGPAISDEVIQVKMGNVQTTHPKAGQRGLGTSPAPRKQVLAVLDKLKDLPQKAQEELRTIEDHKREISNLRRELTNVKRPGLSAEELSALQEKSMEMGRKEARVENSTLRDRIAFLEKALTQIKHLAAMSVPVRLDPALVPENPSFTPTRTTVPMPQGPRMTITVKDPEHNKISYENETDQKQLDRCARTILSFLYHNNNAFEKKMIGLLTGYSHSSGGFNNALSRLNAMGLISKQGNMIQISSDGQANALELLGDDLGLHKKFTIEGWKNQLPLCDSKIFSFLLENRGEHSKEELGQATGYSHTSGGFNNSISHLHALGLIVKNGSKICLREGILEEYE